MSVQIPSNAESVADAIWEQAVQSGLQPGDRIGAERELAERYGVSRWVIRKALETLEQRELILRTNGRSGGIFVAHKKVVRDLGRVSGLPEYLRTQGLEAGTVVLGTKITPADETTAAHFEVAEGTMLIRLDRLRVIDSVPLAIERAWFSADIFPGLLNHSLVGSVYELLEREYEFERGDAVEHIRARSADRAEASMLQVAVGHPLLKVRRKSRLASGEVYELTEEVFRGDSVEIVVPLSHKDHTQRSISEKSKSALSAQ